MKTNAVITGPERINTRLFIRIIKSGFRLTHSVNFYPQTCFYKCFNSNKRETLIKAISLAAKSQARKLEMITGRRSRPVHRVQPALARPVRAGNPQSWHPESCCQQWKWSEKLRTYSDLWNEQSCQISCIQFHSNTHLSSGVIGFEKSVKLSTNYECTLSNWKLNHVQ